MPKLHIFGLLLVSFLFVAYSQVLKTSSPPMMNPPCGRPATVPPPPTNGPTQTASRQPSPPSPNSSGRQQTPPPPSSQPTTTQTEVQSSPQPSVPTSAPRQPNRQPTPNPYSHLKNWVRSFDGTGNNLQFTNWGSAGQPQSRFCPNNYEDGLSKMPTNLPNPRQLSNSLGDIELSPTGSIQLSRANWNMLFPLWGQFTEHDISLTSFSNTEHVPIAVPQCDPTFDKQCTGTQKIPFTRSAFDPTQAVRTQINLNTAWLDGSQIYGSSKADSDKLRSFIHSLEES